MSGPSGIEIRPERPQDEPAEPRGLECQWPCRGPAWMVAEVEPDALSGRTGRVIHHPAFSEE